MLTPQATVAWKNTVSWTKSLEGVSCSEKPLTPSPAAKTCAPLLLGPAAGLVQPLNCWRVTRDRHPETSQKSKDSSHCTKRLVSVRRRQLSTSPTVIQISHLAERLLTSKTVCTNGDTYRSLPSGSTGNSLFEKGQDLHWSDKSFAKI